MEEIAERHKRPPPARKARQPSKPPLQADYGDPYVAAVMKFIEPIARRVSPSATALEMDRIYDTVLDKLARGAVMKVGEGARSSYSRRTIVNAIFSVMKTARTERRMQTPLNEMRAASAVNESEGEKEQTRERYEELLKTVHSMVLMGKMPEKHAAALLLRHAHGLAPKHIAAELGIGNVRTVKTQIHRGFRALLAELGLQPHKLRRYAKRA